MSLIKFGGGVIQMSGSIAGNTFARNRFGNYVRARTKPVNPNSDKQAAVRAALSYLAEYWSSTLTAEQRTAWATYAAAVAMKNRLGEVVYLTGFNHFIRSNTELKRLGLTLVADGPTELSLPTKDPTFAIAATADDQKIAITFDDTEPWCDIDEAFLMVYMGRPQIITRNFFAGPWQYTGKIDGDSATPPTTGAELDAVMTLTEGQKVWCYSRLVLEDGRVSEPMFGSCTVAAS